MVEQPRRTSWRAREHGAATRSQYQCWGGCWCKGIAVRLESWIWMIPPTPFLAAAHMSITGTSSSTSTTPQVLHHPALAISTGASSSTSSSTLFLFPFPTAPRQNDHQFCVNYFCGCKWLARLIIFLNQITIVKICIKEVIRSSHCFKYNIFYWNYL